MPLASPLASSSRERLVVSWLTRCPLSRRAGRQWIGPTPLIDEAKYERLEGSAQGTDNALRILLALGVEPYELVDTS